MTVHGETTTFVYDGNGALVKKETPLGTTVYPSAGLRAGVGGVYEHFQPQEGVIGEVGQIGAALAPNCPERRVMLQ